MAPLAVDAGLGEMRRLGYLLTKKLEPRVRLGAVTTTLPLVPDRPVDIGVADFYRICKKCAICCPSASIPTGELEGVNGRRRWKLNAETCFAYWGKVGTGGDRNRGLRRTGPGMTEADASFRNGENWSMDFFKHC